ncbi:TolC family outer membrane protein [Variovorax guangxiensis]|nr:TolC family outer membrane protein [Variovorax guangxiensis]
MAAGFVLSAMPPTMTIASAEPAVVDASGAGLPAVVRAAVQWHPRIRTTAGQLLQAGEGIAAARAGYYPQIRGGVGMQLSNRDITPYESRRLNQSSLTVSQMIYDFGKVAGAVNRAEAGVATARAEELLSVDDVARETALAWMELYRQQVLGRVADDQVKGVQALADLVNERERKGASSRSDTAQASSRVDAARAQQLTAQAQAARWRSQLTQLTGAVKPVVIAGEPPAVLGDACRAGIDASMVNPPAVKVAEAQRALAQADLRVADANLLPTLSLDGAVGRGIDARSRLPGENGVSTSISVNFSAPLYEGGGNQARKRAAAYAVTAADAAVAQAQLVARQSFQDAQAQSAGHAARQPVLASRIESIRATRDLYRQQYLQLGTRSLLDLLNSEQEYHTARFEQADSLIEVGRLGVECLYQTDRLRSAFALEVPSTPAVGSAP